MQTTGSLRLMISQSQFVECSSGLIAGLLMASVQRAVWFQDCFFSRITAGQGSTAVSMLPPPLPSDMSLLSSLGGNRFKVVVV